MIKKRTAKLEAEGYAFLFARKKCIYLDQFSLQIKRRKSDVIFIEYFPSLSLKSEKGAYISIGEERDTDAIFLQYFSFSPFTRGRR